MTRLSSCDPKFVPGIFCDYYGIGSLDESIGSLHKVVIQITKYSTRLRWLRFQTEPRLALIL